MKNLALSICFLSITACAPLSSQKDMENISLQISKKYVEQKKSDFDIAISKTKAAIFNKDISYLVGSMYFGEPNTGLTSEQATTFISSRVSSIISLGVNWNEYKKPELSQVNSEFGYSYFFKFKTESCEVNLEINYIYPDVNRENKIFLLNIRLNEQKGNCLPKA
jgi:hypothetical protein